MQLTPEQLALLQAILRRTADQLCHNSISDLFDTDPNLDDVNQQVFASLFDTVEDAADER